MSNEFIPGDYSEDIKQEETNEGSAQKMFANKSGNIAIIVAGIVMLVVIVGLVVWINI